MKERRAARRAGWLTTAMLLGACAQPADVTSATEASATGASVVRPPAPRPSAARRAPPVPSLVQPWRVRFDQKFMQKIMESSPPRANVPLLAPGERRVALFVVPGDASVEVDGQIVARRNGVVDLVGKVGDVRRVRVLKGEKSTEEKVVTIQNTEASPALLDLNEPGSRAAGGPLKGPVRFNYDE
jgi:hypothetical protein